MMDKEKVKHSAELLCDHLARLNEEIDKNGFTCSAQVYDMSKTLHGLKSAHALIGNL